MTKLTNMAVIGLPPPRLWKALGVLDRSLHYGFDLLAGIPINKSKESCVLCALTVRDFLRGIGIKSVRVAPVSLIMWAREHGEDLHSVGVGAPNDNRKIAGRWAGHLVTIVNDEWLIDCVMYAALRPQWDFMPGMMALPVIPPRERERPLPMFPEHEMLAGTQVQDDTRPTYEFSACWLDNPSNESWKRGPDANNEKLRRPVIKHLLTEYNNGQ